MINQNLENPSVSGWDLRLWCCVCVLFLVCKHPDKSSNHIINPYGIINLNRRKTPLTLKKPLCMKLPSYRYFRSFRKTCFLGFSFLFLKPKAVFISWGSEGKWTWIRCITGWKQMGKAHQQQKWVLPVLVNSSALSTKLQKSHKNQFYQNIDLFLSLPRWK